MTHLEVEGHWRNQWDPVERRWRRRWVATYEKGEAVVTKIRNEDEAKRLLVAQGIGDDEFGFARALIEVGLLLSIEEVVRFLEKPWHYATELVAWEQAGRPHDASDEGWDEFVEAVT